MESIWSLPQGLPPDDVVTGLAIALFLGRYLLPVKEKQQSPMATSSTSPRTQVIAIISFSALWLASRWWLALVDKYVPEPYLVGSTLRRDMLS